MSPSLVAPLFAPRRRSSSSRRQRRSLGIEPLETRQVMSAAPFVTGLHLVGPPDPAAGSQDYLVTFSEAVTGVDASDFRLALDGITVRDPVVVTGQGTTYRVHVSGIEGEGSLGVDLIADGSIRDGRGRWLGTAMGTLLAEQSTSADGSYSDIAVGDFTADGIVDLAFSDPARRVVDIRPGSGNGTFAPTTSHAVGYGAEGLVAVDVDANRHLDLIVVNRHESTLSVLLADGHGDFLPQRRYGTGHTVSIPGDVVTGDIDGDTDVDLVIANDVGHSIGILLNGGDGTFSAPSIIAMGEQVFSVAIADFNGDRRLDIAAALYDNRVECLFGDGFGGFPWSTSIDIGTVPTDIATGDLNSDGIADVVVATRTGLMTALGSVTGTLRTTNGIGTQHPATSVLIADVTGDGVMDVVHTEVATSPAWSPYYPIGPIAMPIQPSSLVINEGRGDGTFASGKRYDTVPGATAVAGADLDGDRSTDIVVSGTGSPSMWSTGQPSVSIHLNGDGSYPGERIRVDRVAPTVRSIAPLGPAATEAGSVTFRVEFSEAVTGLDSTDFVVATTGTVERGALHLAVHDDHAEVTVGAVRGTGTLRLGIRDGATLGDAVGNAFDPVSADRGDGGATATVAVVSRAGAPAAPALEQVPRGLRVGWTAPADDGGTPITGYTLEYRAADGGDWSSIGLPAGTRTHDVTGLSVGARYDIRVSAVTANGIGTPSAATVRGVVDVPHPPVAVRAESGAGRARVTWEAPADDGGTPVTHYVVRYRAPGETAWTKAGTVPASSRSLTIEALAAETAYEFRVAAWNTVGGNPAAPTAPVTIALGPAAAPTGVVATSTVGGVLLRWTVPQDTGGSPIVGSVIEYRRLRDVAWTTLGVTSTPTASITVGDLAVGGNYLFRVRAVTRAGAGEASQPSRAVTVPPVVPTATALAGGARIDWRAFGSSDGQPVIDYVVEYRRLRDSVWSISGGGIRTDNSATIVGLAPGANYTFRVRARTLLEPGVTTVPTGAVTIR